MRRWLPALLLGLPGLLAACSQPREEFMTRVAEDCTAGDPVACSILRAPPPPAAFSGLSDARPRTRTLVEQDLEAMIRGMARADAALRQRATQRAMQQQRENMVR